MPPSPHVAPDAAPEEEQRLDAVRRYDILDTPPDGAFDRITQLAARICHVPISTISIVDEDRIWFKSTYGLDIDEIGRDPGLCSSAAIQEDPYVVTDAAIDPRTLDNPLVRGELGLRFYAAVPLRTADGHGLGTLNVIDVEPRELEPDQLDSLRDLAAIVVDELELRLAAKSRVSREAERETARYRDAIIAGVSHEMRTPLAVLQGIASLEDDPQELSPEEVAHTRTLRRRQLNHLDWLVRQFLDYMSLEGGDAPPDVELAPTDPAELVSEACDVFQGDHEISIDVDDEVPTVRADAGRSRQIVTELVNNAIRFDGTHPVEVTVRDGGDGTVHIAVSDQGPGIPAEDREHVFDKAYRGRNSPGTGLGLYLSRAFAEAQGSRIDVESEPGAGSTFTLVLPTAEGAPA